MAEEHKASGNFLTRKIAGKVPVWVIGLAVVALWYWYTNYGPGASSSAGTTSASTSPGTGVVDVNVTGPAQQVTGSGHGHRGGRHSHNGTGPPYREVATGNESLDQVAKRRHTTVAHIEQVTRASHEITAANKARFNTYVAHGTSRPMPRGLVYYTSHTGMKQTSAPPVAAAAHNPGTSSASTSPAAIKAAHKQPAPVPVDHAPQHHPAPHPQHHPAPHPAAGSRWRTAA